MSKRLKHKNSLAQLMLEGGELQLGQLCLKSIQAAGFHEAAGEGIPEGYGPGIETVVVV